MNNSCLTWSASETLKTYEMDELPFYLVNGASNFLISQIADIFCLKASK